MPDQSGFSIFEFKILKLEITKTTLILRSPVRGRWSCWSAFMEIVDDQTIRRSEGGQLLCVK